MSYPSRLILRLADAAVVAQTYDGGGVRELLRLQRHLPRHARSSRLALLFATAGWLAPGGVTAVIPRLYRFDAGPWPESAIELVGHGSRGTVYLIVRNSLLMAVKTYRHSWGMPLEAQLRLLEVHRREHELVTTWYNRTHEVVVPALHLVMNGPLLGAPVAGALQAYVIGTKKDLLRDFTDDDLAQLFADHELVRRQFSEFAHKTLECFYGGEVCHNFMGRDNLMLVKNSEGMSLKIVDGGVSELEHIRRVPARHDALRRQVERLEVLRDRVADQQLPRR